MLGRECINEVMEKKRELGLNICVADCVCLARVGFHIREETFPYRSVLTGLRFSLHMGSICMLRHGRTEKKSDENISMKWMEKKGKLGLNICVADCVRRA